MKKALKSVGRFFEKKGKRKAASITGSVLANLVSGASANGAFFGNGETLVQKVGDAVMAIPNMFYGWRHYAHLPEYVRKANATTEYLKEHGQELADSIGYAGRNLEAGTRLTQRGLDELGRGMDYMIPGGQGFHPIDGLGLLRKSASTLEQATDSINEGANQLQETTAPVVEALKQVDLNPVMSALHNLADNVSPDEIAQTLGIAAVCLTAGYMTSKYVLAYWGRRGGHGWLGKRIRKRALKTYEDFYLRNPEEIAEKEGLELYRKYMALHPEEIEKVVHKMRIKELKENGE